MFDSFIFVLKLSLITADIDNLEESLWESMTSIISEDTAPKDAIKLKLRRGPVNYAIKEKKQPSNESSILKAKLFWLTLEKVINK